MSRATRCVQSDVDAADLFWRKLTQLGQQLARQPDGESKRQRELGESDHISCWLQRKIYIGIVEFSKQSWLPGYLSAITSLSTCCFLTPDINRSVACQLANASSRGGGKVNFSYFLPWDHRRGWFEVFFYIQLFFNMMPKYIHIFNRWSYFLEKCFANQCWLSRSVSGSEHGIFNT